MSNKEREIYIQAALLQGYSVHVFMDGDIYLEVRIINNGLAKLKITKL